jgi:hypothetical protein
VAQSLFTSRPDQLAYVAIKAGAFFVDVDTGVITRPSGVRAEVVDKRTAYGRVSVQQRPLVWAMAHRMVWIAAHGLIPGSLQINHVNKRKWDNRLENLELVTSAGNVRHAAGLSYDIADAEWLQHMDAGERSSTHPYVLNSWARFH